MDDRQLEELIARSRRRALPAPPGNLEANALRRVRRQRAERDGAGRWLDGWLPRPALAGLAMGVAIFASLGTVAVSLPSERPARGEQARVALGFEAFADPLTLPTDHDR